MLLRTLLLLRRSPRRSPLGLHDVGRLPMRVGWMDIDTLRHVNNGVYLSLMDLGRFDLLLRAGVWDRMRAAGVYPVVASSTVTHRKSLKLFQRYVLETRVIGYDEKAAYLEQRFVVGGEIYARGIVRGRFLRRGGGTVPLAELAELFGVQPFPVPDWVSAWAEQVALPSTRAAAPSDWS